MTDVLGVGRVETKFFEFPPEALPFQLHKGGSLSEVTLSYETYGELNEDGSNAILVFHALTGSQHASGWNEAVTGVEKWNDECQRGWWSGFVGPGLALDTERFFVVCINYLGGCYGSTGPGSINPDTGVPYGSSFPVIRCIDVVNSQMTLLDHLGVERLHAVTGSSVGGYLSLVLATAYPDRVRNVIPIATGLEVTELQFLHNFEQTVAILNDANFNGGDYYDGKHPDDGLALARMVGHKTFVSLEAMASRVRDGVMRATDHPDGYEITHPMESYIWYQGRKFLQRFDANTYLRLMGLWQHFDMIDEVNAEATSYQDLFDECTDQQYLVFSIDSDVCFYPQEQTKLMRVLKGAGVDAMRITVHSEKGHDSFLLEPDFFTPHLQAILG